MKDGHEYDFRVIAENLNGTSEALETESPILAKNPFDKPGPPGKPECHSRSNNHVEIGWKKPSNDGGAPIKGYMVERKEKGGKKWTQLGGKGLIKDNSFFDDKVTQGKEYEYRVIAVNEGGESEPSSASAGIPARPEKEKPKFDKSLLENLKEIRVKAGEPIDIELPITGAPKPEVTWTKDGNMVDYFSLIFNNFYNFFYLKYVFQKPLTSGANGITLANTETQAKFFKPAAQRSDTGQYEVKLYNSEGEEKLPIKIVVLDKPGQCEGPLEVADSTKTSITLQWKPPKDDGGSDINGYVIEKQLEGTDVWEKCPGIYIQPKATIKHLDEGKKYKFRVKAENIHGEGEPLETKTAIVVKPPYNPPGPPSQPEIVEANFNFVRLQWKAPSSDGGNPINGYVIESKEKK